MSIPSYQMNVELGASGPNTDTCWTGCIEQVSPRHRFDPDDHKYYAEFVAEYNQMSQVERYVKDPEFIPIINDLLQKLGKLDFYDLIYRNPQNQAAFTRFLNTAFARNCRV